MTLLHVLIIIGVSFRVIKVRLPVATSLAWLLLVFFLPLVGAIAYLVLGEKRLGHKFAARSEAIKDRYDSWLQDLPPEIRSDLQGLSPEARSLSRLTETFRALKKNEVYLDSYDDSHYRSPSYFLKLSQALPYRQIFKVDS